MPDPHSLPPTKSAPRTLRTPPPTFTDAPAANVANRASELSDRLKRFETFFATTTPQVRAAVTFESPDGEHQLSFDRLGSTWVLFVFDRPGPDEDPEVSWTNGTSLQGRALDVKIAAAKALPKLVAEMDRKKSALADEVEAAHRALDELAKVVGNVEGA